MECWIGGSLEFSRSQTPFGNAIACETLFRFSKLKARK